MIKQALATIVLFGAVLGNVSAQILLPPTSVKSKMKAIITQSCTLDNQCDLSAKISTAHSQTFDLPTTVSDQFNRNTVVMIHTLWAGELTIPFDEDPKYEVGDKSVTLKGDLTQEGSIQKLQAKVSWKNGKCTVSLKGSLYGESPNQPALASAGRAVDAELVAVVFMDGETPLAGSVGFVSYDTTMKEAIKPLPNGGVLTQSTFIAKSGALLDMPVE